jgi:O-antigen/teichoic acid export membrane protein
VSSALGAARARLTQDRERPAIVWGFLDQALSSGTNLGLSLLAGRLLGAAGLGRMFLGFSAYLVIVGLQRGLLIEPFIAASSSADPEARRRTASRAITLSLIAGALGSCTLAFLGLAATGSFGRGLLIFSPWLVPALAQDTFRDILFRDGRPRAAVANDAIWFLTMVVAVPLAWTAGTDWTLAAVWGVGSVSGAAMGFVQTGLRPAAVRASWSWWRTAALPFGKWNAATGLISSLGGNAAAFVLAGILGTEALGGFRATQSIFAPLSVIIPAISIPGLPAVARVRAVGYRGARVMALRLSAFAVVAATAYVVVLLVGGWRLLPLLFGSSFSRFQNLIWPTAAWQTLTAASIGLLLLLKAERRGLPLLLNRAIATTLTLLLIWVFAWRAGLVGAVWGGAVGSLASLSILAWSSLREPSSAADSGDR